MLSARYKYTIKTTLATSIAEHEKTQQMQKAITLCLLTMLCSVGMYAQTFKKADRKQKSKEYIDATAYLSAGYFGQGITQPGLKIGLEYPLSTKIKRIEKYNSAGALKKTKVRKIEYFTAANVSGFYRPKSETGLLLDIELGRRKVKPQGFKRSFGIGVGAIQTFRNGPTFSTTNTASNFDQKAAAGQTSWQSNLFFAFGKDNVFIGKNNFNWELKYKFMAQFPFGTVLTARNFMEFSLAYPFDLQQKKVVKNRV